MNARATKGAQEPMKTGNGFAMLVPARWGLLAFYDVGRVWLSGETSTTWHTGYGGGVMAEVLGVPGLSVRGTLATTTEGGIHAYVGSGCSF